ncbi:hypothetical protein SAMN05880501_10845 [Ureibacillus xyleni]|uniref:Uncharacterized protein n=1 Tax=Ureibacillus xyleni TaxID=614648 RepID=A0A285T1L4_9BACL|nr:hypothetical protein [Ureibacillus xyleni]SOC15156.1 hypothetical protein SAMN05880501_10845 [Ureibacillus xyleni]
MDVQIGRGRELKIFSPNHLSDDLFLHKAKKSKAKYEIRKEHGYIRHYVTKPNGEVKMIKETKLPKAQENEQSALNMKSVITEMVMDQLGKVLDNEKINKFSKIGLWAQKEKQIEKYAKCI